MGNCSSCSSNDDVRVTTRSAPQQQPHRPPPLSIATSTTSSTFTSIIAPSTSSSSPLPSTPRPSAIGFTKFAYIDMPPPSELKRNTTNSSSATPTITRTPSPSSPLSSPLRRVSSTHSVHSSSSSSSSAFASSLAPSPITSPLPFTRLPSCRQRCDQLLTRITTVLPSWSHGWQRDVLPLIIDYCVGHRLLVIGMSSYHGNNVCYSICPTSSMVSLASSRSHDHIHGTYTTVVPSASTHTGVDCDWSAYHHMDTSVTHGVLLNTGDAMLRSTRSDTEPNVGHMITWTMDDMQSMALRTDESRQAHLRWLIAQRDRTPSLWNTPRMMNKSFPWHHTTSSAVVMPDGRWMIIGAHTLDGEPLPVTECYDPLYQSWHTLAPMIEARTHMATCVYSGRVWCFGGALAHNHACRYAQVYNPTTNSWSSIANMIHKRHGAAAIAIPDVGILIAGGRKDLWNTDKIEVELSMELYTPHDNSYRLLPWRLPAMSPSCSRHDREELTLLYLIDGWLVYQCPDHTTTRWFMLEISANNPTWRSLPDLPTKLTGTVACVY